MIASDTSPETLSAFVADVFGFSRKLSNENVNPFRTTQTKSVFVESVTFFGHNVIPLGRQIHPWSNKTNKLQAQHIAMANQSPSLFQMLLPLIQAILAFLGNRGDEPPVVSPSSTAPIISPTPTSLSLSSPSPTIAPITVTSTTSSPPEPTTFYAIADLPYSPSQAVKLLDQMRNLPSDAEFVVHLGDLRLARDNPPCVRSEYNDAAMRLHASHVPVFVIVGDNDWTDCPNRQEGWDLWFETFVSFESEHWDHEFQIRRQSGRTENFSFVHKGNLFVGLNIVGGVPGSTDTREWEVRLSEQLNWLKFLVRDYRHSSSDGVVGRVVVFGHANPNSYHNRYFFNGLKTFVRDELKNQIPMLYMNGDQHVWQYNQNWYGQSSWLRVMLSGNAIDPPTKVTVQSNGRYQVPSEAFRIDRRLDAV